MEKDGRARPAEVIPISTDAQHMYQHEMEIIENGVTPTAELPAGIVTVDIYTRDQIDLEEYALRDGITVDEAYKRRCQAEGHHYAAKKNRLGQKVGQSIGRLLRVLKK